jgi:hypothetical protein
MQNRVRHHAQIVAKQYCLGYEAAVRYANAAANGSDPVEVRDRVVTENLGFNESSFASSESLNAYHAIVKEFDI